MSLDDVQVYRVDTYDDARRCVEWFETNPQAIAVDSETHGVQPHRHPIRLLQFGDDQVAWVFSVEGDRSWAGLACELLEKYPGTIIGHNLKFDERAIRKWLRIQLPLERCHDTMLMSRVVDPTRSAALKRLAAQLVDPRSAAMQGELDGAMKAAGFNWSTVPLDFATYWFYAGVDCVLTRRVYDILLPRVRAEAPKAYELELAVSSVCGRMEDHGIKVDTGRAEQKHDELLKYCDELVTYCQTHFNVHPGKNAEIIQYLQKQDFEFTTLTAGGSLALNAEVLESVDHPLSHAVLQRRKAQKVARTYLRHFFEDVDDDDRLHPSVNFVAARTGRMSMSDPNLQNLPRSSESNPLASLVRSCIVPAPGHTLVFADFAQIEWRLFASLTESQELIDAFQADDFFTEMARGVFNDPSITKKDDRRQITKNAMYACVPLETEIFTQRGWLKHNEVCVGDLTIGFNFETQESEWTKITRVQHYDEADLVRLTHAYRSFTTTPNHRWVSVHEKNDNDWRYITTNEQPAGAYKLVLAANASKIGGNLSITDHDAALIGWALGDGRIHQGKFTGGPAQGRNGERVACYVIIRQCKPDFIGEIDELVSHVDHKRHVAKQASTGGYRQVTWRLDPHWSRRTLRELGMWQVDWDPWQLALSLSDSQRRAMIRGLNCAEGSPNDVHDGKVIMSQQRGKVADLMIALGYLTGHYVKIREREVDTAQGWTRAPCVSVCYQKPYLTGQRTYTEELESGPVWCVATGLGTWTMRQDETPVLTGNTIYGAGDKKFAWTAGISLAEAKQFKALLDQRYPAIRQLQSRLTREAETNLRETGTAFLRGPLFNRKFAIDDDAVYKLINYVVQGTAAEVLKLKLTQLAQAGLQDYLVIPVHDEVILEVPDDSLHDVVRTVLLTMNDPTLFATPLEAEVSVGQRWSEKVPYHTYTP